MQYEKAQEFFEAACSSAHLKPSLTREKKREGTSVQPDNYHYAVCLQVTSYGGLLGLVEALGMIKLAQKSKAFNFKFYDDMIVVR